MSRAKLYLALAAVAALTALVVPATSSAASFQWSAPGSYSSKALGPQLLTLNGSSGQPNKTVKCASAAGSGTLSSLNFSQFELTVSYSGCTAFGFTGVQTTPVTYRYDADGSLDVVTPLTISVPTVGCTVKVSPQKDRGTVKYANNGSKLVIENAVGGIAYSTEGQGAGSLCPASGSNGTLTGLNELERVGGGSVNWQP